MRELTTRLSELLKAPTVYSVNGANAVSRSNKYGKGYIMYGGNDRAVELWLGLNKEKDIVLSLGFDPGEYTLNMYDVQVGMISSLHIYQYDSEIRVAGVVDFQAHYLWNFSNLEKAFGQKDNSFQHRIAGKEGYHLVRGDIASSLKEVIAYLETSKLSINSHLPPPQPGESLNTRVISRNIRSRRKKKVTS